VHAQRDTIQAMNRTIRDFADDPRIPADEHWEFFCECGCFTLVTLSIEQFDACDGVWAPGHDEAFQTA
jgi:hypothetical protein